MSQSSAARYSWHIESLGNALLLCAPPQLPSLPQEDEDVQLERRGDLLAPLKVRFPPAAQSVFFATVSAFTTE
jgi:hypothetical protein